MGEEQQLKLGPIWISGYKIGDERIFFVATRTHRRGVKERLAFGRVGGRWRRLPKDESVLVGK
jgi:hypothetical protein